MKKPLPKMVKDANQTRDVDYGKMKILCHKLTCCDQLEEAKAIWQSDEMSKSAFLFVNPTYAVKLDDCFQRYQPKDFLTKCIQPVLEKFPNNRREIIQMFARARGALVDRKLQSTLSLFLSPEARKFLTPKEIKLFVETFTNAQLTERDKENRFNMARKILNIKRNFEAHLLAAQTSEDRKQILSQRRTHVSSKKGNTLLRKSHSRSY